MNIEKKINEVKETGFAKFEGVLSQGTVQKLLIELEVAIQQDLNNHTKNQDQWMVHNCMLHGSEMMKLLEQPKMHEVLASLMSDTCILYSYQSSSMPPNGTNYSNRIHVDCPRFIPNYVSNLGVIFTLTPFTEKNGATYFLPKSLLSSEAPSEKYFFENAKRVYCQPGDMIVFNARTWHAGGVNNTNEARHALTMNVCRSFMRQRFDFPRMIEAQKPEMLKQISSVGKRFLGYSVRVPTSLEEFYLPIEKRLYLPNQG